MTSEEGNGKPGGIRPDNGMRVGGGNASYTWKGEFICKNSAKDLWSPSVQLYCPDPRIFAGNVSSILKST